MALMGSEGLRTGMGRWCSPGANRRQGVSPRGAPGLHLELPQEVTVRDKHGAKGPEDEHPGDGNGVQEVHPPGGGKGMRGEAAGHEREVED